MTPDNTTHRPMTLQQARDILAARFPGDSVCVSVEVWCHSDFDRYGKPTGAVRKSTRFTGWRSIAGRSTPEYPTLAQVLADPLMAGPLHAVEEPVEVSEEAPANG